MAIRLSRALDRDTGIADSVEQLVESAQVQHLFCAICSSAALDTANGPMVLHAARDFDASWEWGPSEPEPTVEAPTAPVAQAPVAAAIRPAFHSCRCDGRLHRGPGMGCRHILKAVVLRWDAPSTAAQSETIDDFWVVIQLAVTTPPRYRKGVQHWCRRWRP